MLGANLHSLFQSQYEALATSQTNEVAIIQSFQYISSLWHYSPTTALSQETQRGNFTELTVDHLHYNLTGDGFVGPVMTGRAIKQKESYHFLNVCMLLMYFIVFTLTVVHLE